MAIYYIWGLNNIENNKKADIFNKRNWLTLEDPKTFKASSKWCIKLTVLKTEKFDVKQLVT